MKKYVAPEIELKEYRLSADIAKCTLHNDESCFKLPGNQQNKHGGGGFGEEPGDES